MRSEGPPTNIVFVDMFLFVNCRSGGRRGARLMDAPKPFQVDLEDKRTACLHIFDIEEGEPGQKPGFLALKQATQRGVVRVAVAGGDGTILWAVEEAQRTGIDTRNLVMFSVVPLGTGNDFARHAGWGGKAPDMDRLMRKDGQGLRRLVLEWAAAKPHLHDIWKITVTVDPDRGSILKTHEKHKEPLPEKSVTKLMHSYCSMGQDARAGMEQEKRRTQSRLGNLFNYALQGCLKALPCRDHAHVKEFASTLYHGTDESGAIVFENEDPDTEDEAAAAGDSEEKPRLLGEPQFIVFLNIPNCYAGLCRFWDHAGRVGVDRPSDPGLLSKRLDPSDGQLEVVTCRNFITAALDCAAAASPVSQTGFTAKRVFSGAPLFLRFAEYEEDLAVHIQIDGEYLKLLNPTSITFVLNEKILVLHSPRDIETASEEETVGEESESSHGG